MQTHESTLDNQAAAPKGGWKRAATAPSLPEVFRSVSVPKSASFWRRLLAFIGPGYMVAVGYMDPGNWATDISGGALYNYRLLSVILISNFIAIFLQALSAKLGLVTGRDLAQACRDTYRKPISVLLWLSAELAIIACDIAEVIGAGIALNLLFKIPLVIGCLITAADVLLVLALQGRGWRWIEALVMALIFSIIAIFAVELAYAHPDWLGVASGFLPRTEIVTNPGMLYISLGILGATVMPHNLYLHSAIVQTRQSDQSPEGVKQTLKLAYTDSTVALMLALFVNAAILILAAAAFHGKPYEVGDIQSAHKMLSPVLGAALASPLFAIALLASGQNSTLTGTLAGQIILEGFVNVKIAPWLRRIISRLLAIVPTVAVVAIYGMQGTGKLLLFSQVILSLQLSFAVIPLVAITSDKLKMGAFVNRFPVKVIGWTVATFIFVLNAYMVFTTLTGTGGAAD